MHRKLAVLILAALIVMTAMAGCVRGGDSNGNLPSLRALVITEGTLTPAFNETIKNYTVNVGSETQSVNLKPVVNQVWGSSQQHYTVSTNAATLVNGDTTTVTLNKETTEVRIIVTSSNTSAQTVYTITFVREQNALSDDLMLISTLLGMKREDAVKMLGKNYTVEDTGGEGWLEGYYYADRGMTLAFYPAGTNANPSIGIEEKDLNSVLAVSCDEKVDINGARVGMNLNQIKAVLGNPTKIVKADASYPNDIVYFEVSGLSISFRMGGKNDASNLANISKTDE